MFVLVFKILLVKIKTKWRMYYYNIIDILRIVKLFYQSKVYSSKQSSHVRMSLVFFVVKWYRA